MPSHNRDVFVSGIRALVLRDKTTCADNIEGSNAEETLGVVYTLGLEDLGADRYSAVDRVGDDENVGVWGGVCDGFGEITNDGGIGVEEVYDRSLLESVSEVRERYAWTLREKQYHRGSCQAFLVRRPE